MIRLDLKRCLIEDINRICVEIQRYAGATNKRFRRIAMWSINADFRKGLREINKKVPVLIELPNMKKEGNGAYSESHENKPAENKEIIVNSIESIVDSDVKLLN